MKNNWNLSNSKQILIPSLNLYACLTFWTSTVWPMMARLYGEKRKHESAFKLAKLLIVKDRLWWTRSPENSIHQTHDITKDPGNAENAEPLTSLLMATSTGIVEIVEEILRVYPQAVDHVTPDKCWNILHVAISHRQLEIFHLVKKMDIPMARLVRRIDEDQCTILHHVGIMKYYKGGTLPGPVLQLQEELQWFEVCPCFWYWTPYIIFIISKYAFECEKISVNMRSPNLAYSFRFPSSKIFKILILPPTNAYHIIWLDPYVTNKY